MEEEEQLKKTEPIGVPKEEEGLNPDQELKVEEESVLVNEDKQEEIKEEIPASTNEKVSQESESKQEKAKENTDIQASDISEEKTSKISGETDSQSNLADDTEDEPTKAENLKEMDLKDVLKINNSVINFGDLFPGQILEETVIILNNLTATKVPFKIKINCLSQEFDDLDEYVYSMRRPTTQDVFNYNDTFLILLAQKAISYYKLAIKVPNILEEKEISGNIEITCTDCKNGRIVIPIKSRIGKP